MSDLATLRSLPDLVDEYEAKAAAAEAARRKAEADREPAEGPATK